MTNKLKENKDPKAFHFSIGAFFKGVGDSLYAFFVSAGEAIKRLYITMFEASMANELFKRRNQAYKAVLAMPTEDVVQRALLENYERHFGTTQKLRALFFESRAETHLAVLWKKIFDSFFGQERPTEEAKKDATAFMLSLIDESSVKHLDFSNYCISLENGCFERFTVFLKELLDCNPHIAHITLHPDNQSSLSPHIKQRLALHQALYMAERHLIDRDYPIPKNTSLTHKSVKSFFLRHQEEVIQCYEVRTEERLSSISPEDATRLSQIGELESVTPQTPWGFIVTIGRSLKQRLFSAKEAFEKNLSSEGTDSIADSSQALVTYAGSASNYLTQSFSTISANLSGFFTAKKEDPWYYFDKTASPVDQLKQRVKEAERMLNLAEKLKNLETPTNEEGCIVYALEKARIFCDIAFNGLFYKPEVNMDFLDDPSIAYDKGAFLAEMDKEKDPVKQKILLINPDKLRDTALWVDAYGDKAVEKRALLNQASDLMTNTYREWLDELNRSPEEGGYPSIGVTDDQGKPINAVQQFINQFFINQKRESLSVFNDIMKSREANDKRFHKRMRQCTKQEELLKKQEELLNREEKIQEEFSEIYRFYGETAEKLEKDPELLERVRNAVKESGFTFSGHSQSHNSFFAPEAEDVPRTKSRSCSDNPTNREEMEEMILCP